MLSLQRGRSALRLAFDVAAGTVTVIAWIFLIVPLSRFSPRRDSPTILWGPIPIPNIGYSARADRLAGYESRSVVYSVYHISRRSDFDVVLDRWWRVPFVRRAVPYAAFLWSGLTTDIYGFFFDGGFLYDTPWWRLELVLDRLAGKRIIVYPYGGDARLASQTREQGRWHAYTDTDVGREERVAEADVIMHRRVFARHASLMLGCADIVDLPRLDGMFLYPFDLDGWEPKPEQDDGLVTVVHAPNHRELKGTRYLIDAVSRLKAEGLPLELDLVEGMSASDARARYERADVIADQFLIGAYALFAIEGMALGKPVVCRLAGSLRPFHPEWAACPIVSADPDTLADTLRRLVTDPALRRELGARGPEYVRRHHSLEAVGARMDQFYRRIWA